MKKRRPTQADVALAAGVSQATVSLILNPQAKESPNISDETRERVRTAIRELGYVVNPAARSLAGGRNRLLGVFVNGAAFALDRGSFYHPMLVGIEEECIRLDYDMLLFTRSDGGNGRRSAYRHGVNHLRVADGSILLGIENKEELAQLSAEGYPFVFIGKRVVPGWDIHYVAADYSAGMEDTTRELLQLGHRKIGYVYYRNNQATIDREIGIREGIRKHNLLDEEVCLPRSVSDRESIRVAAIELLERTGATAIVTEEPGLAYAFAQEAERLGFTAPHRYSLMAAGDHLADTVPASFAETLRTLLIPRVEMGRQAARLLNSLLGLEFQDPLSTTLSVEPHVIVPVSFYPGLSVGEAPTPTSARRIPT
ncbi:LacI family DNA-binding transcriptional regulator [Paenibacillus koleovorans]|uniref:LacI family DNA-binding transcriptional regulator n=1 Tax=Paenibacillus koleovorans TaxID=121608 RepID=UPI0013E38164|nr:LacI family DNA-binding transcriptional regulator [Paenibacillus koleovorans]